MIRTKLPKPRFLRSTPDGCVELGRSELEAPVPLSLSDVHGETVSGISFAAYLEAIERVLYEDSNRLMDAFRRRGLQENDEIRDIDIIVEKHGSDYHPARVKVKTDESRLSFVMNVALTERGRMRARDEFHLLRRLADGYPAEFIPRPYFLAEDTDSQETGQEHLMVMFLADWFEGYHEFHLSALPKGAKPAIVVWDSDRGNILLSDAEAREIYRMAAYILTYYFDTETYREVFPWHHAAGDFVVSNENGKIDAKLVTVRQYRPRVQFPKNAENNRSTAMLLFLANLTVRMRLDRFDGIGQTAWAGEHCVRATFQGFMEAMRQKPETGAFENGRRESFFQVLEKLSPAELAEAFAAVLESYDKDAPDVPVIEENLADHVLSVYRTIQSITPSGTEHLEEE